MKLSELIAIGVAKFANLFLDASDWVEEKTGKSIVDRMTEYREKDEKLKEENPALWAAKKLGEGTIKGITGSYLHKD